MKATKLQARKPSPDGKKDQDQPRVRTGLKAGDLYMHNPR
jgi:hypothetical protein